MVSQELTAQPPPSFRHSWIQRLKQSYQDSILLHHCQCSSPQAYKYQAYILYNC